MTTPELAYRLSEAFNQFYLEASSEVQQYPPDMHDAVLENIAQVCAESPEYVGLSIRAENLKEFYRRVN